MNPLPNTTWVKGKDHLISWAFDTHTDTDSSMVSGGSEDGGDGQRPQKAPIEPFVLFLDDPYDESKKVRWALDHFVLSASLYFCPFQSSLMLFQLTRARGAVLCLFVSSSDNGQSQQQAPITPCVLFRIIPGVENRRV